MVAKNISVGKYHTLIERAISSQVKERCQPKITSSRFQLYVQQMALIWTDNSSYLTLIEDNQNNNEESSK